MSNHENMRTIMKAFSPTKASQHRVYEERKIVNFSNQDVATKFDYKCNHSQFSYGENPSLSI